MSMMYDIIESTEIAAISAIVEILLPSSERLP